MNVRVRQCPDTLAVKLGEAELLPVVPAVPVNVLVTEPAGVILVLSTVPAGV